MWRDPLDELIDELERAKPKPIVNDLPPFADVQEAVALVLWGKTDEEKARGRAWMEELERPGYKSKFRRP
jgi:hypothetical protein